MPVVAGVFLDHVQVDPAQREGLVVAGMHELGGQTRTPWPPLWTPRLPDRTSPSRPGRRPCRRGRNHRPGRRRSSRASARPARRTGARTSCARPRPGAARARAATATTTRSRAGATARRSARTFPAQGVAVEVEKRLEHRVSSPVSGGSARVSGGVTAEASYRGLVTDQSSHLAIGAIVERGTDILLVSEPDEDNPGELSGRCRAGTVPTASRSMRLSAAASPRRPASSAPTRPGCCGWPAIGEAASRSRRSSSKCGGFPVHVKGVESAVAEATGGLGPPRGGGRAAGQDVVRAHPRPGRGLPHRAGARRDPVDLVAAGRPARDGAFNGSWRPGSGGRRAG